MTYPVNCSPVAIIAEVVCARRYKDAVDAQGNQVRRTVGAKLNVPLLEEGGGWGLESIVTKPGVYLVNSKERTDKGINGIFLPCLLASEQVSPPAVIACHARLMC